MRELFKTAIEILESVEVLVSNAGVMESHMILDVELLIKMGVSWKLQRYPRSSIST
jgi:hypothetical protein